ncbi:MAG: bile acid:sodium symporter family protein [Pleurocapsa sp. MO_226.B13]|nr:bile acid:sodium symporter family protein [Pleurocapsa sp. MO_226.B13]
MESNFLTAVFLPLALFIIMLSMGMGLTINDFKRVTLEPKSVVLGLIAQLIILPVVGFAIAVVFSLSPELAVGLIILTACPGGATSNMMTYLAKGNVALSITLTAVSSLITVFTIPLVVNLAMQSFMGEEVAVQLSLVETTIKIAVITIIPVALGMISNHYTPRFAVKAEKLVKWLSVFFLALIVFGLLLVERANFFSYVYQVGGSTFVLNVSTMALGFGIATIAKLKEDSVKAITVEVGIQNGTLAIAIASAPTFLSNPTMAIPAAIYSLLMYLTCAVFGWWMQGRNFNFVK